MATSVQNRHFQFKSQAEWKSLSTLLWFIHELIYFYRGRRDIL